MRSRASGEGLSKTVGVVLVCRLGYRIRGGAMGGKARLGGREESQKRTGPSTTEPNGAGGIGLKSILSGWALGSNLQDPSRAGVG